MSLDHLLTRAVQRDEYLGFGFWRDTVFDEVWFRPPEIPDAWIEGLARGGAVAVLLTAALFVFALFRGGRSAQASGFALCASAALVGAMRWFADDGDGDIAWDRFMWMLPAVGMMTCLAALGRRPPAWRGWLRESVVACALAFVFVADRLSAELGAVVFATPWFVLLGLVRWRVQRRQPPRGTDRLLWKCIAGAHAVALVPPAIERIILSPFTEYFTPSHLIFGTFAIALGAAAGMAALVVLLPEPAETSGGRAR